MPCPHDLIDPIHFADPAQGVCVRCGRTIDLGTCAALRLQAAAHDAMVEAAAEREEGRRGARMPARSMSATYDTTTAR